MKAKLLFTSIVANFLFLLFGGYIIHKRGGLEYLKIKFSAQKEIVTKKDHSTYYYTKKSIFEIMPNDTEEIIFLGNSIINHCDWHELFGKSNIKNRGIKGDLIQSVIDRLKEIVESNPKKIFLMIGTNDLSRSRSVDDILFDYEKLISLILAKTPETELYLQSLLPTKGISSRKNIDIIEVNKGILQIANKLSLTYVNLFDLLKTDNNQLNMEFSFDGLHINGKGYLIWRDEIIKYIDK
jgi:lysophospholipase L1-like esterase